MDGFIAPCTFSERERMRGRKLFKFFFWKRRCDDYRFAHVP